MVGNSDDETNFPHKLLLTNRQPLSLRKAFNNHTSTDIKFSKAQLNAAINKKNTWIWKSYNINNFY